MSSKNVGECCVEKYLSGECERDCDDDNDCEPCLFDIAPGCSGEEGDREKYAGW